MPRCDSCNKFVSLDSEQEPDVNIDVDKEGNVAGEVRIVNTCQECSQEMAESTFTVDVNAPADVAAHLKKEGEHDLAVEGVNAGRTDRYIAKDKNGRPIKPRYQKHMYGAEMTIQWSCACDAKWSAEQPWEEEVQASGMDSLV